MRIVISGYYGFSNVGDDAILEMSIRLIRNTHPDAQISVITYPGSDLDAVYHTTGLTALDGSDVAHCDQLIAASDLVLIGGGGLIQDYLPSDPSRIGRSSHNNLVFWMSLAVMAHAHQVPVSSWFIGIGPLRTPEGRRMAGQLLSMMTTVLVRDEGSADLARQVGITEDRIRVAADPVFLREASTPDSRHKRRIAVALRSWEGADEWIPPIAEALDRLIAEHNAEVVLVPFQGGRDGVKGDDIVALRLGSRMQQRRARTVLRVGEADNRRLDAVANADAVLAMRLHAVIAAVAGGACVVALAYDPKVSQALELVERSDHVRDLESPDGEWIYQQLERCLDERSHQSHRDQLKVAEVRSTIHDAAARLLTADQSPPKVPSDLLPALVASLAVSSTENSTLEARLDRNEQVLAETTLLGVAKQSELDEVRKEFQAFRDSRAVQLAQVAWNTRTAANKTAAAIKSRRRTGPQQEVEPSLSVAEVIADAGVDHPVVVFAPGIHWDVELFQRPQQMALAFARAGYTVLYQVDEQYRADLDGYRRVSEGVYEGYLPDSRSDELSAIDAPLYVAYVYNYRWGSRLTDPVTVYEHIDHLEVFEHVHGRADLMEWHSRALTDADIVVGSARDLVAELRPHRPDCLFVPNGVDATHFQTEASTPSDLSGLIDPDTPVVGYYGALAEWFNYPLIHELADRLDDHAFLLIGPDYDGTMMDSKLADRDNVHWLGARPYSALPGYLQRFDVATIPFRVNEITHAVSPLKLFEYMAGGKPVVTAPLRECASYDDVLLADGPDEWVEMIGLAEMLGRDPDYQAALRSTASANTWDARVAEIMAARRD